MVSIRQRLEGRRAVAEGIAIVVLNWRGELDTVTCVESVLEDAQIGAVVLVDNESTGRLADEIRKRGLDSDGRVSILEVPENRGFAGGINLGIHWAMDRGFGFVGTVNSDAIVVKGCFSGLASEMLELGLDVVAPVIVDAQSGVRQFGSAYFPVLGVVKDHRSREQRVSYLSWACVLVRLDVFKSVGLLDERFFMYWEDVRFSRVCLDAGWSLGVSEEMEVVHRTSTSHSSAGPAIDFYSGFGGMVLGRLEGGLAPALRWLRLFVQVGRRLVSGRWANALWVARGVRLGFGIDLVEFGPAWQEFSQCGLPWMRS